jgi:hypothetical protein
MHPRLDELLAYIDRHHQALLVEVDRVPEGMLNVRPETGRWSVAEVLDHLAITASRIAKLVGHQAGVARTEGVGPDPEHSPVSATLNFDQVVDRTARFAAPSSVAPRDQPDADRAKQELAAAHDRVRAAVTACDGIDLSLLTAPHPAFGALNLYQWLAFIGGHEARHALQVAEIGAALRERAGGTETA